jgi:hypothetical protein
MVNTVGKNVSEVTKSYTAGFLDADGAIMATIERHKEKRFGFRVRVIVKITQKSKEHLEWFERQFGFGRIVPNRTTYDWIVKDQSHVLYLLQILEPYVLVKKEQTRIAQQILGHSILTQEDVLFLARLADSLSVFNVRSKSRRRNHSLMVQDAFSRND